MVQYNSFNPEPMGLDKQQIIEYTEILKSTYTDLSSYRYCSCYSSYTWAAQLIREAFKFGYLLQLQVQGHQSAFLLLLESLQFILGMLKD